MDSVWKVPDVLIPVSSGASRPLPPLASVGVHAQLGIPTIGGAMTSWFLEPLGYGEEESSVSLGSSSKCLGPLGSVQLESPTFPAF